MRFVAIIWKNIYRRKMRSLLTICGLGVAVATVVSLVGISESFQRHFIDLYTARNIDMVVQRYGVQAELSVSLPEELGDRIRKLPHVTCVIGGLTEEIALPEQGLPAVFVDGWPDSAPLFDEVKLIKGRRLHTGDFHKLIIGQSLADKTGKTVGDTFKVYGEPYEILGIFTSKNVFDGNAMVTMLGDLQQASNRPDQVTGFIVRTDLPKVPGRERSAGLARMKQQIEALEPGVAAERMEEFVRNVGPIRSAQALALVVSAIALRARRNRHAQYHGHVGLRTHSRNRHIAGRWLAKIASRSADSRRSAVAELRRSDRRLTGRQSDDRRLEPLADGIRLHRQRHRADGDRGGLPGGARGRRGQRDLSGDLGREFEPRRSAAAEVGADLFGRGLAGRSGQPLFRLRRLLAGLQQAQRSAAISSAVRKPRRRSTGNCGHQPSKAYCSKNAPAKPGKTNHLRFTTAPSTNPPIAKPAVWASSRRSMSHSRSSSSRRFWTASSSSDA